MLSWVVKSRLQPRLARPWSPLRVSFLLLPTNPCPLTPIHSLLFSIHYALFCFPYLLTPLLLHSYENCRGVPNSSHYGTEHATRMRVLSERRESKDLSFDPVRMPSRGPCAYQESITYAPLSPSFSPFATRHSPLSSFFSRSCALFCTLEIHNCFPFNRFRTLSAKHRGVGGNVPTFQLSNLPTLRITAILGVDP